MVHEIAKEATGDTGKYDCAQRIESFPPFHAALVIASRFFKPVAFVNE